MRTLTLPPFPGTPVNAVTQQVWARNSWSDSWTELENLWCERLTWSVAPGLANASFRWRYGRALAWETGVWQTVAPLTVSPRGFVKVTVTGQSLANVVHNTRDWYGVWNAAVNREYLQRLTADGLEVLLSYATIANAWYLDAYGALRQSGCGLTFNQSQLPNRSAARQAVNGQQVYVFDVDASRAAYWSSRDMAEYLLAANVPVNSAGAQVFVWQLVNAAALANYDRPTIETHGRVTLDVLNAIANRHRALAYYVEPYTVPGTTTTLLQLKVFTFAETAVSVTSAGGGAMGTIPANADTWRIVLNYSQSAEATVGIVASHVADRVRVTGARRVSVCSLALKDGSLAKGWANADRERYEKGASEAADYPSYDQPRERKVRDAEARSVDDLANVYQRFELPDPWDQKLGDGLGTAVSLVQLAVEDDGITQFRIPESEFRLLKWLPLLTGYNYSGSIIGDAEALGTPGHRGTQTGYPPFLERPAMVLLQLPNQSSPEQFAYVDRVALGATEEIEYLVESGINKKPVNRTWSANVRIEAESNATTRKRARDNAVVLNVTGAHPHVIASEDYAPTRILDGWPSGGPYEDDKYVGAWDYSTIIATVAIEESRRCEAVYPAAVTPLGDFINELVIDAGDEYKQIYVVPSTVVDVDGESRELVRSDGGYLQDDRDALAAIARRAYEWYSRPRYALGLSTGWFQGDLWLGSLVLQLVDQQGNVAISSVVTEITVDFPIGARATPAVAIATSFAELDPLKMV